MGSPGFFKWVVMLAIVAGLAYGAKVYFDKNKDTIQGPTTQIYQPPAVPNPYHT